MSRVSSRPKTIGKYRILHRLGAGGMSRVYRAVNESTGREVALKVTPVENDDDVEIADYQREVMMGRRLDHPNIISPLDHGCQDEFIYMAMPVATGASLANSTRLRDPSRKPSSRRSNAYRDSWLVPYLERQWYNIAKIGLQLSSALVACHAAGIIHRDIKPGNVILSRSGHAFLMDFGLAWMRRGPVGHELVTKAGTARYLPPEIFRDRRDERSDVYSLGLTLHELATGLKVWGDVSHEEILESRPDYRVPRIRSICREVPSRMANCIDKASADEPGERHQSAAELFQEFQAVVSDLHPQEVAQTTLKFPAAYAETHVFDC